VTIRVHVDAVLARLRVDPVLAGCTFQGVVLNRPERYVTVHSDNGFREQDRFAAGQLTQTFSFTVHTVGRSPEQSQALAERVYAQLLGVTLVIPGRRARRIRSVVSRPTALDRDVDPPLFYGVDVFELTSEPE
jgi:hypothetical protein